MRIQFDYLDNQTVLGHKVRCEILAEVLQARGHELTTHQPHWVVCDYPNDFLVRERAIPTGAQRLVMGQLPQAPEDTAWHPLHAPHPRTLTGLQYLIVDPWIKTLLGTSKDRDLLVSLGGYDGYKLTEKIIGYNLPLSTVVVGQNFGRTIEAPHAELLLAPEHKDLLCALSAHKYVVCGWGQTVFEALALGCQVVAIVQSDEHADEAWRLGIPYVTRSNLTKISNQLELRYTGEITLHGAERVAIYMEDHTQY